MKTLLLISQQEKVVDRVNSLFSLMYTLFTVNSHEEALDFLNSTLVDVVIVDSEDALFKSVQLVKDMRKLNPDSIMICLLKLELESAEEEEIGEEEIGVFDYVLTKPLVSVELRVTVQKAFDEHSLKQEVKLLRKRIARG